MTISTTSSKAGPYQGNGVTTSFAFNYKTFAATDLVVTYTNASGTESTLVKDTHYTVSLNADQEASPGGSITYPISGSPLAASTYLTITRVVSGTQPTDLVNGGSFQAQTAEDAFDRAHMFVQQLREKLDRALVMPVSDTGSVAALPTAANRANKILAFDASGNATASALASVGTTVVTPYIATLLDDTTASDALTTLGVSTYAKTLLDDTAASDALTTLGVSTYAKTLLDDTTASDALTTLGVSTYAKTLLDDATASDALTTLGVSTYAKTLLDDTTAGAALTTLGVSSFAQTVLDDADASTARTTLGLTPYTSGYLTVSIGGVNTLAHGLGGMPSRVELRYKLINAAAGYSAGDEILICAMFNRPDGTPVGFGVLVDATNITVRASSPGTLSIIHKTTGSPTDLAYTDTYLIVRAWL